jgi:hypothetical protein
MKKRHLIFLMGYKNTGKDTVAKMINEMSFNQYDIVGFADALKRDYYQSIGVQYDRDTEDRDFKEMHRPGIISYGENMKQNKGMWHWVETALDPLLFDKESKKGIIVPDCRRVEEVVWMKDFMQRRHPKYNFIYDRFEPHFFAVHREGAEDEDSDYLTRICIRVAAEEMFMINRFIKNYKDLKHLKGVVEEIYACRLK